MGLLSHFSHRFKVSSVSCIQLPLTYLFIACYHTISIIIALQCVLTFHRQITPHYTIFPQFSLIIFAFCICIPSSVFLVPKILWEFYFANLKCRLLSVSESNSSANLVAFHFCSLKTVVRPWLETLK